MRSRHIVAKQYAIRVGFIFWEYQRLLLSFKAQQNTTQLAHVAEKNGLQTDALQNFVDVIIDRMIFNGEQLSDLMAPLELGWRERSQAELDLIDELVPLLKKLAQGREISGLKAYE